MSVVLALDPGGTTGFATWDKDCGFHAYGHIDSWLKVGDLVEELVVAVEEQGERLVVVYETFTITAQTLRKSRSYDALWLIGVLQYVKHSHPTMTLVAQTPAQKRFGTDAKLTKLGWGVKNEHAKDAARHLLVYLYENGIVKAEELVGDG